MKQISPLKSSTLLSRKSSTGRLQEEKESDSESKLSSSEDSFLPAQNQSPLIASADEKDRDLEKDVAQILSRRKIRSREVPDISSNCFDISPRKVVLQPNQAVEFTVHGLGLTPNQVVESWICRATIGDEKTLCTLYETKIRAQFCRPELRYTPTLSFSYFSDLERNNKKPWVEPGLSFLRGHL